MLKPLIGIPSYSGSVSIGTMRSLLADLLALKERGDQFELFDEAGCTSVVRARGVVLNQFLSGDYTHLFFIDDDVCWQQGALLRLLDHDVDLVGGAYPKRIEPLEWPIGWLDKKELYAVNGLLEVAYIPAGFMCISKNCIEKMQATYQHALFDDIRQGERLIGEDIAFCNRWREIGGKVWLDPEIAMGHDGQKLYTGHIGDWLRDR